MENNVIKTREWNRKKINACWVIILLIFFAALLGLVFQFISEPELVYEYIISYVAIPTLWLLGLVSSLEIINKLVKTLTDYVFIIVDSMIAVILIATYSGHDGLHFILMGPIIISAFYFNKKKVIFSCILNIFMFFLLYQFNTVLREQLSIYQVISAIAVYLGSLSIAIGVINRGIFYIDSLKAAMKSEQDLLIRNALMDKNTKTDGLTELYNHKTFYEYLDSLIKQSETYNIPLQLAIIDIDDFKKINDIHGHWVGDIILKRVAASIQKSVTPNDVVSRYGGEEFAIIFTEKSKEEAYQIVEKIRDNISKLKHEELKQMHITVSVGLQTYIKGNAKEMFFRNTDACLYLAKKSGKNKTVTELIG